MSIIEDTKIRVDNLIESRNQEIDRLETAIIVDESDEKTARQAMEAASDSGNLKEYQAAKTKLENALDSKEMHEKRKTKLEQDPLIDGDTYKEMIQALTDDMDRETAETIPRLAEKAEEMNAIGQDLKAKGNTVNDLLRKIEVDLYKNHGRRKNPGPAGGYADSVKTYKGHNKAVIWSYTALDSDTYREYKKHREAAKNE